MFCLFWSTLHPFISGSYKEKLSKWRVLRDKWWPPAGMILDPDKQLYFFLQTIYKAWKLNYNGSLDVVKLKTGFHMIAAIATITVIAATGEKK